MKKTKRSAQALLANIFFFLLSYVPLLFMMACLVLETSIVKSIIMFGVGILLIILFWVLIGAFKRESSITITVTKSTSAADGSMVYVATYILPLALGLPSSSYEWSALVIYFLVLFSIFSRTDLKSVNPTLFLMAYRVLNIQYSEDSRPVIVITKEDVQSGKQLKITQFVGEGVFVTN